MLFELSKKEKLQRINRQSLHMFPSLLNEQQTKKAWANILQRTQPKIKALNYLRIATCIELNYYIQTVFQIIKRVNSTDQLLSEKKQKQPNSYSEKLDPKKKRSISTDRINQLNPQNIEDLKIGIIGGGVMGRLILNSLLVFTKDGLNPKNITLSTRQAEDLESYQAKFGVKVIFNNEETAEQSDILIICVPSTLDNWIINDLRQFLDQRIKQTNRMHPMVFVTTSNISSQKLKKLFQFPILCPSIRGQSKQNLNKLTTVSSCQDIEQQLAKILLTEQKLAHITDTLHFMFSQLYHSPTISKSQTVVSSSQYESSQTVSLATHSIPMSKITSQRPSKVSKGVSMGVSEDVSIPNADQEGIQALKQLIEDILSLQSSPNETFLVRAKKWRMAYYNYIS